MPFTSSWFFNIARPKGIALALLITLQAVLAAHADVLETIEVDDGVYVFVGPLGQRDPENLGNNATFGAVITEAGAVLIDPGGSAKGAAMLDSALRTVTDKPVVLVINTGGQDHRWLGNGYFRQKGARIIASAAAVADQKERVDQQFLVLENLIGADGLAGTEAVYADEVFSGTHDVTLGEVRISLFHPGGAHTPGDTIVWLPDRRVAFSGDIVYLDRMLGVLPFSNSAEWLTAFEALAALKPAIVVPGHGRPGSLEKARVQTYGYLQNLREKVRAVLDAGGDIHAGTDVDQSAYSGLANFDTLARRNAQAVFIEMEFE